MAFLHNIHYNYGVLKKLRIAELNVVEGLLKSWGVDKVASIRIKQQERSEYISALSPVNLVHLYSLEKQSGILGLQYAVQKNSTAMRF